MNGVMIALLPLNADWCEIDLPHLTVVYAGQKDDLTPNDYSSLAKDAAMMAMVCRPLTLGATHLDVFGEGTEDNPKVDVLRFRATPELMALRRMVASWNASEHPFNPHVTIGPEKYSRTFEQYPRLVTFDRLTVGWGEEYMTFWLNKNY